MWKLWMVRGRGGWGAGRRLAEGAVLQTIKYLLNCHLSSPPQRRGQGWWFALPRSSAGAIKMRRRHRWSVSVRSTDDASHRSYPALQATKRGLSRGNLPLDPVLLPFAGAKGGPRRGGVQFMPLQKAPRRRRRDKTTTIVLGGNPSVSLAAASSPCTGEPLVQCYTPLHRGALGQV